MSDNNNVFEKITSLHNMIISQRAKHINTEGIKKLNLFVSNLKSVGLIEGMTLNGSKGRYFLIDGASWENACHKLGKSIENVDGIIITHSHHDHISGAGVLARRFNIPIYMSKQTFLESRFKIGNAEIKQFKGNFRIKNLEIKPIQTSHNVHSQGLK